MFFYLLVCFAIGLVVARTWSVAVLAPSAMGVAAYLSSPIAADGLDAILVASALVPACVVIAMGIVLSVAPFATKRLLHIAN